VSDTNKHFKFDSHRKLNPWLKIWTKFLDVVTKLQNIKDHWECICYFSYLFNFLIRNDLEIHETRNISDRNRQLRDLSSKVQKTILPMFTSRKLKQGLSLHEPKPNIVTQEYLVYLFKCDLCDAGYVGNTKGHLHTRIEGHRQKMSSIYKHYSKEHNTAVLTNFLARFNVIKKCTNKFNCLVNEMLCIQDLKPALNV